MTGWIDYLNKRVGYYSLPLFLFIVVPLVAGIFLTIGLRDRRDATIPHRWWALMIATLTSPVLILAIAFAYAGDPVEGKARSGAGFVLILATITGLASPLVLGAATLHWSDRRDDEWRVASAIAGLSIIPGTLVALLGSMQALSGVSL